MIRNDQSQQKQTPEICQPTNQILHYRAEVDPTLLPTLNLENYLNKRKHSNK